MAYDIVIEAHHPAHLHVWRTVYRKLTHAGLSVFLLSRDRDVMAPLTREYFGQNAMLLTRAAPENRHPWPEFLRRQSRVYQFLRRHQPRLVLSLMGVYAQSARWLGIPNWVFTDSEFQSTAHRLAHPFASRIFVPSCFATDLKASPERITRYDSYHELAYLHPEEFSPDPRFLSRYQLAPSSYFIVRLSSWNTHHDRRLSGLGEDQRMELIQRLRVEGPVFVVAEEGPQTCPWSPSEFHQALAFARAVVTEGASTASEAAVLGTPALYANPTGRGYLDEQADQFGLVINCHSAAQLGRCVDSLLALSQNAATPRDRRRRLLEEKINLSELIVDQVMRQLGGGGA